MLPPDVTLDAAALEAALLESTGAAVVTVVGIEQTPDGPRAIVKLVAGPDTLLTDVVATLTPGADEPDTLAASLGVESVAPVTADVPTYQGISHLVGRTSVLS